MTPYHAALARRRHLRRRPDPVKPTSFAPNRKSANNNSLKRKGDGAAGDLIIVRPAAAAPPRRPEH
jgi:hypothetical protein